MNILTEGETKVMAVGNTVRVPVPALLLDLIEGARALSPEQHETIIKDAGIDVPPLMPDQNRHGWPPAGLRLILAMSLLQNVWYTLTQGSMPATIADGHRERLEKFEAVAEETRRNPPKPSEPKAPKEPKPPRSLAPEARYLPTEAAAAARLGAQAGLVRDALLLSINKSLTLAELTDLVVQGGKLVTKQPVQRVVNYYLKQFEASGLARVVTSLPEVQP